LSLDLLLEKLKHCRNIPPSVLGYDDMRGNESFRKEIAKLLETYFFHRSVDVDGIFCCAGAGCALDLLFQCLLEQGDGVLLPAPYYPGFIHDIEVVFFLRVLSHRRMISIVTTRLELVVDQSL